MARPRQLKAAGAGLSNRRGSRWVPGAGKLAGVAILGSKGGLASTAPAGSTPPDLAPAIEVASRSRKAPRAKHSPIHPGEVLAADFLVPLKLSQYRLARSISVPPRRVNEIVHGERAISADTALRFARFFGTSDRFWLNLQTRYDLEVERDRLGARLDDEVTPLAEVRAG